MPYGDGGHVLSIIGDVLEGYLDGNSAEVRDLLVESVDAVRGDVSDEDVITFYRVLRAFEKNICSLLSDNASKEE